MRVRPEEGVTKPPTPEFLFLVEFLKLTNLQILPHWLLITKPELRS